MIGIERAYCDTAISALLRGNYALLESKVCDALENVLMTGKGDTLGLDAKPEIMIAERLKSFDQYATLITEERGQDGNPLASDSPESGRGPRTFFICDPTDRSSALQNFLLPEGKSERKVGEVLRDPDALVRWEESNGRPAGITGPYSSITCVRRGVPICSVLLNYLTQELTVACSAGIYSIGLPDHFDTANYQCITTDHVRVHGKPVHFRAVSDQFVKRFATFLGKSVYRENILDSRLVRANDLAEHSVYDAPGGPSRILYLSERQSAAETVGFIVANGEKIGEWIHWLTFVRFGTMQGDLREPALRAYEVFQDRPWTRDGVLMSTLPAYSIFRFVDGFPDRMVLDVDRLGALQNPSLYRSTILIAPTSNEWALQIVQQYGHRPIRFYGDY